MNYVSRRDVLKGLTACGLNLLLPGGLYAQAGVQRRISPNSRLRVGVIGVGGRGEAAVAGLKNEEFVAFCDVDDSMAANTYNAYPKVMRFKDYRRMLDRMHNHVDAIAIAIPDHAHFAVAMMAVKAGFHVFVEKPMCQTIAQTRELLAAATAAGVKTQMGNQGHSSDRIRDLKEWVDAGVLGPIMSVHAWTDRPTGWWPQGHKNLPSAESVPRSLNWDLWRNGVDLPYSSKYLPFKWRGWTMWGGGALGDMACHVLDPMFFALDPGMPDWVCAETEGGTQLGFPLRSTVVFHFPATKDRPEFELTWHDGKDNRPPRPGMLESGRVMGNENGGSVLYGSRATAMTDSHATHISIIPDARMQELKATLPAPSLPRIDGQDHYRNWTNAIRGAVPEACSSFDYAARLNELVLLGVIAQRVPGVQLEWDSASAKFANSALANQLVSAVRV